MSSDPDRIAVPTNGRGPHAVPGPVSSEDARAAPTSGSTRSDPGAPSAEEMSLAFTPRQLAVGFGIIASLVLLAAGLARRRRPVDDD
jgi:hypothetical protein